MFLDAEIVQWNFIFIRLARDYKEYQSSGVLMSGNIAVSHSDANLYIAADTRWDHETVIGKLKSILYGYFVCEWVAGGERKARRNIILIS